MINFLRLKQDMEAVIDGMLVNNETKKISIYIKEILLFNLLVFSVLGLFTILYLKGPT